MNPYHDEQTRAEILTRQLEVNALSQAANAARKDRSPDYDELLQKYRDANQALQDYVKSLKNSR